MTRSVHFMFACHYGTSDIDRLTNKIKYHEVFLDAGIILLHVGTNDINSTSVDGIITKFERLFKVVKEVNPQCVLIISFYRKLTL